MAITVRNLRITVKNTCFQFWGLTKNALKKIFTIYRIQRLTQKHLKTRVWGSDQKLWNTFLPSRIATDRPIGRGRISRDSGGSPRWQKQYRTSEKHSKTRVLGSDQKHWKAFLPSRIQRLTQKHSKTRVCGSDQKHWKTFLPSREGALDVRESRERRDKIVPKFSPEKQEKRNFGLIFSTFLSRIACCARESTSAWQNLRQKKPKKKKKNWISEICFYKWPAHPVFSGEFSFFWPRKN